MSNSKFGLNFINVSQELFFGDFYNFLPRLGKELSININNNRAYITTSDKVERLCVFPSDDGLLHFEFSTDFSKPLNLDTSFPIFCETNKDLETIKMFTRYVFGLELSNYSQKTNKVVPQPAQVQETKNSKKEEQTTLSIGDKTSVQGKYIWEFF